MSVADEAAAIEGGNDGREPSHPVLKAADWLCVVASGLVLLGMMVMTTFDVIGRYLFNAPLGFAFEATQLAMATVVFLAIPSVTLRGLHITVDLVENLFRGRVKVLRDVLIMAVIAICLGYLAWRLSTLAGRFVRYGEITTVLRFPVGYIAWLGTLSLGLASLFVVANMIHEILNAARSRRS